MSEQGASEDLMGHALEQLAELPRSGWRAAAATVPVFGPLVVEIANGHDRVRTNRRIELLERIFETLGDQNTTEFWAEFARDPDRCELLSECLDVASRSRVSAKIAVLAETLVAGSLDSVRFDEAEAMILTLASIDAIHIRYLEEAAEKNPNDQDFEEWCSAIPAPVAATLVSLGLVGDSEHRYSAPMFAEVTAFGERLLDRLRDVSPPTVERGPVQP